MFDIFILFLFWISVLIYFRYFFFVVSKRVVLLNFVDVWRFVLLWIRMVKVFVWFFIVVICNVFLFYVDW